MKSLPSLLFLFLSGACVAVTGGREIEREELASLQPGRTTKAELLDAFGAPVGILRRGEVQTVQAPWGSTAVASDRGDGSAMIDYPATEIGSYEEINASGPYALFLDTHELTSDHRLYYYYHGVGALLASGYSTTLKSEVDRLWVLVDERRGLVVGYVFRDHEGAQVRDP